MHNEVITPFIIYEKNIFMPDRYSYWKRRQKPSYKPEEFEYKKKPKVAKVPGPGLRRMDQFDFRKEAMSIKKEERRRRDL